MAQSSDADGTPEAKAPEAEPPEPAGDKGKGGGLRSHLPNRLRPDRKIIALLLVYFTVFVDFMGVANLIPVLPFLVGAQAHKDSFSKEDMFDMAPGAAMSVVLFSFNLAQLISGLVFGPTSDRIGRKPLLLASLIGGTVGYVLQGLAIAVGNFPFFIAMRLATGLFGGSRTVATAYIADAVPPEQRARLMGMLAISVTLAMQFGPVLGGSLGTLNLALPCYVAGAVSGVGTLLVWSLVVEVKATGPKAGGQGAASTEEEPKGDKYALMLNMLFSFCLGFWAGGVLLGFALLMPTKFNFDPNTVGLAALGDGVTILLGNPIYLFLLRYMRVPTVAIIGSALMAIGAACPFLSLIPLLVLRYLAGLGAPVAIPCASAVTALIAPPSKRGSWSGATIAAQALGRTISPLVVGALFDADYRIPFVVNSAMVLVGLCACVFLRPRVPMPRAAAAAVVDDDAESEALSEHTQELVLRLRERQEGLRQRLDSVKAGQPDPQATEPPSPERRASAKEELSTWLVEMMERHGYAAWPEHLDGVKLMLFNSFPPLRAEREDKLADLMNVLEGHIHMAERAALFEGAEDLMQALL